MIIVYTLQWYSQLAIIKNRFAMLTKVGQINEKLKKMDKIMRAIIEQLHLGRYIADLAEEPEDNSDDFMDDIMDDIMDESNDVEGYNFVPDDEWGNDFNY